MPVRDAHTEDVANVAVHVRSAGREIGQQRALHTAAFGIVIPPNRDPQYNPTINPALNPTLNPAYNPTISPETYLTLSPK